MDLMGPFSCALGIVIALYLFLELLGSLCLTLHSSHEVFFYVRVGVISKTTNFGCQLYVLAPLAILLIVPRVLLICAISICLLV